MSSLILYYLCVTYVLHMYFVLHTRRDPLCLTPYGNLELIAWSYIQDKNCFRINSKRRALPAALPVLALPVFNLCAILLLLCTTISF